MRALALLPRWHHSDTPGSNNHFFAFRKLIVDKDSTMSKKRPGVQAGLNLVRLDDVNVWEDVEEHCRLVIEGIPKLEQYEVDLEEIARLDTLNKAQLLNVVNWKHSVGKNRIYNVKYLNANDEASVQTHSTEGIARAKQIDVNLLEEDGSLTTTGRKQIQETINTLTKLKGVGPATASAILTLIRPDVFCYLYDEVIDCFENQRDYKISNYMRVNTRCLQIARKLGDGWTTSRVAKTIWTAARFLATQGEDLTESTGKKKRKPAAKSRENTKKPAAKKRPPPTRSPGDGSPDDKKRPSRRSRK